MSLPAKLVNGHSTRVPGIRITSASSGFAEYFETSLPLIDSIANKIPESPRNG